ncbi:hypothetical protein NDI39_03270 [Microcoleus sp. ZQ-A2]|nr:hypothetical protein [Microcoleus sp. FACHB-1]
MWPLVRIPRGKQAQWVKIRAIAHGVSSEHRLQKTWIVTRKCANHQAWLADWRDVRYNADEQCVER